jgi:tetratricopeptide (TPR) repeat protein
VGGAGIIPADQMPANRQAPAAKPPLKPKDELEQKADMQRLVRLGNEVFAQGNYQQALRRYEQAVAAAPQEPTAYFHLAQAHLALNSYGEAVLAIQRGLRRQPHWPLALFQPRALYRDRIGEYQQHLAKLADAVAKNLNDDSLLFLLGYQLWFDGRQDEALALFQRAATLALDTTFLDNFLKVAKAPGVPVVER